MAGSMGKWLWRGLAGLVLAAATAATAGVIFQRDVAQFLFVRAVDANLGRDRSADLPDGLHVFICGAGSPMADPHRGGPCVGIVAGRRAFVIDAGSGGARSLARMGFPLGRIERVYLTHLHSDHIDGLGELLLQAWIGGSRQTPLPVTGPIGTGRVVEGFNTAYEIDAGYRLAHHGPAIANPAGFGAVAEPVDLRTSPASLRPDDTGADSNGKEGETWKVLYQSEGLRITAIPVDHAPVHPAFGYRIDYKGRSVSLSGDTVLDQRFIAASSKVDVMLHEALSPAMVRTMAGAAQARGLANIATILNDILDYHTPPEDAARAAAAAGAGRLVLYHIVPPLPSRLLDRLFQGDAAAHFEGPVEIARDGMLISLPAGSDAVSVSQLF